MCAGEAVAGAGLVRTAGSELNHLLVFDADGAFAWAGSMPSQWTPASLSDTELVTCVTELPRHEVQVCEYIGSDITRYAVTDEFLVVEPSSGEEVARFTITGEPRTCAPTELESTTELTGFIEPEVVAAHLTSLVERGVFVDPDLPAATGKPDTSDEPGASNDPSGKPTTPPVNGAVIDLRAALADDLVTVTGTGDGLSSLDLELSSEVDRTLEISIEPGTMLDPRARATQTMMVVWGTTVTLEPLASETLTLDVACVQMHQDQPTGDDTFTVTTADADPDMVKLLAAPELAEADGRVTQFAVWTISNNPKRNDYVGLTSGFSVLGSGPTAGEIDEIRALFESAGIDTDKYRALR